MPLEIVPLTTERWALFEGLFGGNGAYGGCWCMYFRQEPSEWKARTSDGNRAQFLARVGEGPP